MSCESVYRPPLIGVLASTSSISASSALLSTMSPAAMFSKLRFLLLCDGWGEHAYHVTKKPRSLTKNPA